MASIAHALHQQTKADTADALALAALALARRFAAGATMWCVAPHWREHARHVAVEFVHPVIVGKPALPAVSIDAADTLAALRPLVAPGDVVLTVAAIDAESADLCRRAAAWGAMSIWIGAGERPSGGAADHVVWAECAASTAPRDGSLVLQYHLLWELTHVCLEHPGLLRPSPSEDLPDPAAAGVCITCSDEGRLAEVVAVEGSRATVRTACGIEAIDVSLVGPTASGDLLLVHAGIAITRLEG